MLIYLYGPDTFRSRQQLKKMIEKFKIDRDPQGLNVVVVDAEKEEAGVVLQQISASPFLAERRMVVLENLLSSTGKKELQEDIFDRIKRNSIPESTVLLFWEGGGKLKTDISKKFHALLSKEKFAQEFLELTGVQLGAWIKQEVEKRGGHIENASVQFIIQNIGSDTWFLNSIIDQLVSYTDKEITSSDVQLFLSEKADDNIFNLVDAIVAGQSKQVYKMIREQYTKGEDAQYVFAMILRQFRILLELRDLYEKDDTVRSEELAKKLSIHPFVVKKSFPFVKRYTLNHLKSIYRNLLKFDIQTKTGQGDQSVLLDVLVGSIST